jgi:hypothetical protein
VLQWRLLFRLQWVDDAGKFLVFPLKTSGDHAWDQVSCFFQKQVVEAKVEKLYIDVQTYFNIKWIFFASNNE